MVTTLVGSAVGSVVVSTSVVPVVIPSDPELDSREANVVEPPDVTVSELMVTEVDASVPEDPEVAVRVASETSAEAVVEGMLVSADEETDGLELTGLHGPAEAVATATAARITLRNNITKRMADKRVTARKRVKTRGKPSGKHAEKFSLYLSYLDSYTLTLFPDGRPFPILTFQLCQVLCWWLLCCSK